MSEFRNRFTLLLHPLFLQLLPTNRLILFLLVLLPGLALADSPQIELIGGKIETQGNGDVVLTLDIAPTRLNQLTRIPMDEFKTWGDVHRQEATLREVFLDGLYLHVNNQQATPTEVSISTLATEPDQALLPQFISVKTIWRNVGLIHMAFAPNLVTAKFKTLRMIRIQLVLEENLPWWRVLSRSVLIGFEHIVPSGLDHILFVLGIYLAACRFRDLLWQVTSFTVAHSITLGLTMSGVFIVGPFWEQFVEIGIAVSIFFVAFENCWSRKPPGWRRILIVGGFGLVHGMGFAGRLSEVKWPPGTFFLSLFGANLGIELGQLTVIGAASLVTAWWWHRSWYQSRIAIPISLLIGLYGMFAALERISQFSFPKKEVLDFLWSLYDKYYWAIPFCIGTGVLVILWIVYRIIQALCRHFISSPQGIQYKQNENGKNPPLNQVRN